MIEKLPENNDEYFDMYPNIHRLRIESRNDYFGNVIVGLKDKLNEVIDEINKLQRNIHVEEEVANGDNRKE